MLIFLGTATVVVAEDGWLKYGALYLNSKKIQHESGIVSFWVTDSPSEEPILAQSRHQHGMVREFRAKLGKEWSEWAPIPIGSSWETAVDAARIFYFLTIVPNENLAIASEPIPGIEWSYTPNTAFLDKDGHLHGVLDVNGKKLVSEFDVRQQQLYFRVLAGPEYTEWAKIDSSAIAASAYRFMIDKAERW